MEVVLFDQYASGHHLEYASRMAAELDELGVPVSFLGVERTEHHDEFFDSVETSFLAEETAVTEHADSVEIVEAAIEFAIRSGADALYFLQIDDVTDAIYRSERHNGIDIVGELNGAFFRNDHLAAPVRSLLGTPVLGDCHAEMFRRLPSWAIERVPSLAARTVGLYGCLRTGRLDNVLVHSREAKRFVEAFGFDVPVSEIPDPLDPWFEWDSSRLNAQVRLGLPDDEPIALYFGQLRDDKGIKLLLEALGRYDGPAFKMVIAGPPDDVDEQDLAAVELPSQVSLRTDIEFVPQEDVPYYFLAADAVVVPYRRQFGAQRTSGVFQKACGSLRPLIAPNFGTLGRRVEEHGFGMTFEAESPTALAESLAKMARSDIHADVESMRTYANRQAYERAAELVVEAYENR